METWFDQKVNPKGFGIERAWLQRDLPHLGIVVTLSKGVRGEPVRLSTWDRQTRQRIRCRAAEVHGDESLQTMWTSGGLPGFTATGALVFYLQHPWAHRPGVIHVLGPDALETERRIESLPQKWGMKDVVLSPDGSTLSMFYEEEGKVMHAVICVDTGIPLWQRWSQPPPMVLAETFFFSPCSTLGVVSAESSVQSGSDWVEFSVVEARTGASVLDSRSPVWDESLCFSEDGKAVLLAYSSKSEPQPRIRSRWDIPERWHTAQTSPPLPPPSVRSWEAVLASLETHPTTVGNPGRSC